MRIGCCATPELAHFAAQAGFDYVEVALGRLMALPAAARSAAVDALERCGLPVEAFNVLFAPGYQVVGDTPTEPADVEVYVRESLDLVRQLGGQVVVYGSGASRRVPDGFPRARAWEQLVAFLRLLGDTASERGARIAIEPLNRAETNLICSVAEGAALARDVAHPAIGVLADNYHMEKDGEPLSEVAAAGDRLWHAHVSAIDRSAPLKDGPAIAQFFRSLHDAGYDGRVSIECRWDDFAAQTRPALEFLRRHTG